jgi:hypothetical protein
MAKSSSGYIITQSSASIVDIIIAIHIDFRIIIGLAENLESIIANC